MPDLILLRWLSKVNGTLKTPVFATAASGLTVATLSAMLELESLVEMMSIGTLLAYSMVSYCVLVLRYETSGGQLGDYLAMSDLNTEKQRLNPGLLSMAIHMCFVLAPKQITSKGTVGCK